MPLPETPEKCNSIITLLRAFTSCPIGVINIWPKQFRKKWFNLGLSSRTSPSECWRAQSSRIFKQVFILYLQSVKDPWIYCFLLSILCLLMPQIPYSGNGALHSRHVFSTTNNVLKIIPCKHVQRSICHMILYSLKLTFNTNNNSKEKSLFENLF